jgi:hypothetical protein
LSNQTKEQTIKNIGIGAAAYGIGSKLGGLWGLAAGYIMQAISYDPNLKTDFTPNRMHNYTDNTSVKIRK